MHTVYHETFWNVNFCLILRETWDRNFVCVNSWLRLGLQFPAAEAKKLFWIVSDDTQVHMVIPKEMFPTAWHYCLLQMNCETESKPERTVTIFTSNFPLFTQSLASSGGPVEYPDCFSAEG